MSPDWRPAVAVLLLVAGTALAQAPDEVVDLRGLSKGGGFDTGPLQGMTAADLQLPRPKRTPSGRFDEVARKVGRTGTVRMECRIETDGRTADCKVTQSVAALVDAAALDTVKDWKFTPLLVRGEPRAALMAIGMGSLYGSSPTGRTADPTRDKVEELRYKGREYDARDP